MVTQLPLHERVSRLFDGFRHQGSPADLDPLVASHVTATVGRDVTADDVSAIRRQATEPATDVLEAVAAFFKAPAAYLVGTAVEQSDYNSQLDYFDNVRNSQATVFALRTRVPQLTPDIAERLSVLVRDTHLRFESAKSDQSAEPGHEL